MKIWGVYAFAYSIATNYVMYGHGHSSVHVHDQAGLPLRIRRGGTGPRPVRGYWNRINSMLMSLYIYVQLYYALTLTFIIPLLNFFSMHNMKIVGSWNGSAERAQTTCTFQYSTVAHAIASKA